MSPSGSSVKEAPFVMQPSKGLYEPKSRGDHVFEESSVPRGRFFILSVGICMGLFLSIIDTSIVATSLYRIGTDFQVIRYVNWIALAYTLAYLSCAVTFARVSDIVGRHRTFAAAYILFFAFSLGCGFSQNLHQLIACRTLQGIGGSGLYSLSMIMLPEICPQHLRHVIGGLIGLVIAAAGVLGPVLGGILTHYATWKWIFWINGPIGGMSMALFLLSWPPQSQLPTLEMRSWREFDFVGSFLLLSAAVLVVYSFQNVGESLNNNLWNHTIFIAPLVCGLACWAGLAVWESLVDRRLQHRIAPTFPVNLFRNRFYTAGAFATLFMGFPFMLLTYSLPLRAQVVSKKSPLVAGIMLLPMLGTTAVGSVLGGALNSKRNHIFETILAGTCLMTLGCGLLSTVGGSEDDTKALGFLTFAGLGFGLSTSAATIMTGLECPIRDYAPAQGIIAQLRILGGSLGIAMSTVLADNQLRKRLTGSLTPEQLQTLGRSGKPLTEEQAEAIQLAYSHAFKNGMKAAVVAAGVSAAIALFAWRHGHPRVQDQREARMKEEMGRRETQNVAEAQEMSEATHRAASEDTYKTITALDTGTKKCWLCLLRLIFPRRRGFSNDIDVWPTTKIECTVYEASVSKNSKIRGFRMLGIVGCLSILVLALAGTGSRAAPNETVINPVPGNTFNPAMSYNESLAKDLFTRPLNRQEYLLRDWMWIRCNTWISAVFDVGGSWIGPEGRHFLRELQAKGCKPSHFTVDYYNGADWGDARIMFWWGVAGCNQTAAVNVARRIVESGQYDRVLYVYDCRGHEANALFRTERKGKSQGKGTNEKGWLHWLKLQWRKLRAEKESHYAQIAIYKWWH